MAIAERAPTCGDGDFRRAELLKSALDWLIESFGAGASAEEVGGCSTKPAEAPHPIPSNEKMLKKLSPRTRTSARESADHGLPSGRRTGWIVTVSLG